MMRSAWKAAAGTLAAAWLWANVSTAENEGLSAKPDAPCSTTISRKNVMACALRQSPEVRASGLEVEAMRGRETAASTIFPSNPSLSLGLGKRTASAAEPESLIWSASLGQEIEIGGQRGARLEAARAEVERGRRLSEATRREIATSALDGYFEALAALEQKKLADALARVAKVLVLAAEARAKAGFFAPIEADIAEAASVRILQGRFAAERELEAQLASLATRLGLDPSLPIEVEGELSPLPVPRAIEPLIADALANRADIAAAEAESRAHEARLSLYSRSRIPNPTVSVFAESERPDELRFGLGLSFPIPLPAPLGPSYRGEIAEASALAAKASTEAERLRRETRRDIVIAANALVSRRNELEAFPDDLISRAHEGLDALAREVESGRLPVRDALLTQQSLIELLRAYIDARRNLCRASVELLRVANLPLEEVMP